jgi:ubiquinone/menaquinone biosynthesis C-methylase UbiE/rRNA maturation protein Nop10
MGRQQIRYKFNYLDACNMCGSSAANQKILGKRLNQSQGKKPENKIGITTTICKCKDCGLIYSNPQPVPFDLQDHYGIPPEKYWKKEYFLLDENYFKGEIERLKKLLDFSNSLKSLDIGAGLGKQMIALSKVGFDTYGFEPSKPFYERAISQMGIDPEKLKLKPLEDAEYPDNYFDFISFGVVLEHVYDPSGAVNKAMRWLKPNGIIHVEVPSSDWLINKLINFFYTLKLTDYVGNISPMHEPFHLHEFSINSFERHALQNNYEIAFYEYYVCETFLPKIADYFLKPIMKQTDTGMQLCVWLRKK